VKTQLYTYQASVNDQRQSDTLTPVYYLSPSIALVHFIIRPSLLVRVWMVYMDSRLCCHYC